MYYRSWSAHAKVETACPTRSPRLHSLATIPIVLLLAGRVVAIKSGRGDELREEGTGHFEYYWLVASFAAKVPGDLLSPVVLLLVQSSTPPTSSFIVKLAAA